MAKLQIDLADGSNKVVEVDDSFLDLSPEQQEKTVVEIRNGLQGKPNVSGILSGDTTTEPIEPTDAATVEPTGEQEVNPEEEVGDDTWIGQTIGGTGGAGAGAAAGAYAGSFLAPFTLGLSVPIGALLGGAAGGYFGGQAGERVEQSLTSEEKEIWKAWDDLDDKQRQNIYNAGIEEGVWGLVPGIGGGLAKGSRVVFKGGYDAGIDGLAWLASKVGKTTGLDKLAAKSGSLLKSFAPVAISRLADAGAGRGIKGQLAKTIAYTSVRNVFSKFGSKSGEEVIAGALRSLPASQVIDFAATLSKKNAKSLGDDLVKVFEPRLKGKVPGDLIGEVETQLAKQFPTKKFSIGDINEMASHLNFNVFQKANNALKAFKKKEIGLPELTNALEPFLGADEVLKVLHRWGLKDVAKASAKTAGTTGSVRQGFEGLKDTYDSVKEGDYGAAATDLAVSAVATAVPFGIGKAGVKIADKLYDAGRLAGKTSSSLTGKSISGFSDKVRGEVERKLSKKIDKNFADDLFVRGEKVFGDKPKVPTTAPSVSKSVQSKLDEVDASLASVVEQSSKVKGFTGGKKQVLKDARESAEFGPTVKRLEGKRAAILRSPEVGKIPDAIKSKLSNINVESLPTNPKRMLGVVEKQLGVSKPTNTKEALEYLQTMSGVSNELLKTGSTQANRLRKELTETVENISKQFGLINNYFFNKGGKALSNKISKIHGEGYDAPGQAYAIAKSMGYNYGGKVIKLNDGGSVNSEVVEDIIEGAHTPDTVYTHLPQGAYIVNAATTANPQFRKQLLEMGGTVIKKDFKPIDPKHPQAVPAMVAIDEIMIKPSQARKHNDYLEAINGWGRNVKSSMGT